MKTDMMYEVLYGYSGLAAEGVQLNGVKEVADFILTHGGGMITEEDGTPFDIHLLKSLTPYGKAVSGLNNRTGG